MRRVAIVTGASAGIGRATALKLARDGFAVVLTARRGDRLIALEREIVGAGGEALALPGDIADAGSCERVVRRASEWGRIEVIVANAGFGYSGRFEEMSDETTMRIFDVNVHGVLRTIRASIPHLRDAGRRGAARIVVVGSVLSRISTSGNAAYCATKHALVGFADALRQELRGDGIAVISILPGYTDTEFFEAMPRREADTRTVASLRRFGIMHTAEDVAELIARRIRRPASESVVGRANAAAVFLATRFPRAFYMCYGVIEKVLKGDVDSLASFFRARRGGEAAEVIPFNA